MCIYSMVVDAGRQIPNEQWTYPAWDQFKQILDAIAELDKKLNQPDCEDPEKAKWMAEIEERLKKLEAE